MNPYLPYAWASSSTRLVTAAVVTLAFAMGARFLRGVNDSGAAAGGAACLLLFIGAGPAAFLALAVLFAMTWLSTRLGCRSKRELGLAEHTEGRHEWQVLANLGAAALASLLYALGGDRAWLVATAATLAEAATDTVASEVGQTYGRDAILITTGQSVPSGTDGGITLVGTLSGIAAALILTAVAVLGGIAPRAQFWIPAATGIAGMFLDSVLGATLQKKGWINNETVNFGSTLVTAALAYALAK